MNSNNVQVYLCPASKKNMNHSINNSFDIGNNTKEYIWAFNESFEKKWNRMEIGSLCIFGNTKDGFYKAAFVKTKIDIKDIEDWPFRSPSGLPWRWGFTLNTPFIIKISANEIKQLTGLKAWMTQILLKQNGADAIIKKIGLEYEK